MIVKYDNMNAERGGGERSKLKGAEKSCFEPERCRRDRHLLVNPQGCVELSISLRSLHRSDKA